MNLIGKKKLFNDDIHQVFITLQFSFFRIKISTEFNFETKSENKLRFAALLTGDIRN